MDVVGRENTEDKVMDTSREYGLTKSRLELHQQSFILVSTHGWLVTFADHVIRAIIATEPTRTTLSGMSRSTYSIRSLEALSLGHDRSWQPKSNLEISLFNRRRNTQTSK